MTKVLLIDEESMIKAAGLYCEDYITKPADVYIIRSKIDEIVKIRLKTAAQFAGNLCKNLPSPVFNIFFR